MMKLIVTIDTEEDNWGRFDAERYTVNNIERIPTLQECFDRHGVIPTYLVSYPVVMDDRSVFILRTILKQGRCEIGNHCHPWNTPPLTEMRHPADSMLCNLDTGLQFAKIEALHRAIVERFGIVPTGFRAGRWGFDPGVARVIRDLGYRVDTSVTPLVDWSRSSGPDYTEGPPTPYRFSADDVLSPAAGGELVEVPASVGFLQGNTRPVRLAYRVARRIRLNGILHRLRLLNKVWLSPELSGERELIRLIRRFHREGSPLINLTFHSPSLMAGLTPFVRTAGDEKVFLNRIEACLRVAGDLGIQSIGLSEAVHWLNPASPA